MLYNLQFQAPNHLEDKPQFGNSNTFVIKIVFLCQLNQDKIYNMN